MQNEVILKDVVIKFAGDSGDGMQLTGQQFTNNTAILGIDLATFPDFPAEIRAPIGTLPGVSGFQVHFSSDKVYTPGDACDVLVAMNAAALKVNLKGLKKEKVDTLILGCTHYPLLKNTLKKVMGERVELVDSANEVALEVKAHSDFPSVRCFGPENLYLSHKERFANAKDR